MAKVLYPYLNTMHIYFIKIITVLFKILLKNLIKQQGENLQNLLSPFYRTSSNIFVFRQLS